MSRRILIIICLILMTGIAVLFWFQQISVNSSTAGKQIGLLLGVDAASNRTSDSPSPLIDSVEAGRRSIAPQQTAKRMNLPFAFYAKTVDQSGAMVPDVILCASVESYDDGFLTNPANRVRISKLNLRSDTSGNFDIKQGRGAWLRIETVEKEGYLWQNPGFGAFGVGANAPTRVPSYANPNQRLALHLWKKGVAEPVIRQSVRIRLRAEQEEYAVNLLTGQLVSTSESPDLVIQFALVSDTNAAARAHRTLSFAVRNGGILETEAAYPYLAATAGYGPGWQWVYLAADAQPGQENWERNFYVRARKGRVYAGLHVKFDSLPMLVADVIINPTGSPLLEPDPAKQITDPEEIRRLDEATRVR